MNMKINNEYNWSQEISDTEKRFIQTGLKDIEEVSIFSHNVVIEEIRKTYGL
jgi:hypothetical protein